MKKHCMKWIWILAGTVLGFASVAKSQPAPPTARAELRNAGGEIVGQTTLSIEAEAVVITLEAQKLPPGPHGFHIHEVGKCEACRDMEVTAPGCGVDGLGNHTSSHIV